MALVDLDLFYDKDKFCNLGFYMEKCDIVPLNLLQPVTWNLIYVVDCMSECMIMSIQSHGLLSHFNIGFVC